MDLTKYCQSCATGLTDKNRCFKNSGERTVYCNYCMDGLGNFREPDLSYDDMFKRGMQGIENANANRFVKWMMKKSYPVLLPKMDRWQ